METSRGQMFGQFFFKPAKKKNAKVVVSKLEDHYGQNFTRMEDLDWICHKFYKELYQHKDIPEEALGEVLRSF